MPIPSTDAVPIPSPLLTSSSLEGILNEDTAFDDGSFLCTSLEFLDSFPVDFGGAGGNEDVNEAFQQDEVSQDSLPSQQR